MGWVDVSGCGREGEKRNTQFLINIYVHIRDIMNRHEHQNMRNVIVWAQTSHNTKTCLTTLCVTEL